MTVPVIRKSTQRNSSWPGDYALHTKAEYICADLLIALRFSLAVARRTIHRGEVLKNWSRLINNAGVSFEFEYSLSESVFAFCDPRHIGRTRIKWLLFFAVVAGCVTAVRPARCLRHIRHP